MPEVQVSRMRVVRVRTTLHQAYAGDSSEPLGSRRGTMSTQSLLSFRALGLASVLVVAASAAAAAQRPAPPSPHPAPQAAPKATEPPSRAQSPTAPAVTSFTGVATRLGTTPEALEGAYQTARQSNPQLTRGQFVAVNILAKNLGSKNPSITTDALLGGLASGKSIGQTLQGLGVSAGEAQNAEAEATREAGGGMPGGQ
jgi:hypothetical protein